MSVVEQWTKCRDWMLPAIAETHGTHTEDDVVAMLIVGRLRLWVGQKCALITEFQEYPRMKVLNVFLVGGESQEALVELRAIEPALIEFAKANGCRRISGGGRRGWERLHSDWQARGVIMYKDLQP